MKFSCTCDDIGASLSKPYYLCAQYTVHAWATSSSVLTWSAECRVATLGCLCLHTWEWRLAEQGGQAKKPTLVHVTAKGSTIGLDHEGSRLSPRQVGLWVHH